MILSFILLTALHIWLFYARQIRFYKKPYGTVKSSSLGDSPIVSPVEGTVVYISAINGSTRNHHIKMGRELLAEGLDDRWYLHIGIYMSPYNNHHLHSAFAPHTDYVESKIGEELLPMLSHFEPFFPFLWRWDWYNRKLDGFISKNQRYNYVYENGVVMTMIMDKYVSKMTKINQVLPESNREVLGFVHRGSQLDLFLPSDYWSCLLEVGQRVNFNTLIAERK